VAGNRHGGVRAIKERLQVDAQYAAHLASLVSHLLFHLFQLYLISQGGAMHSFIAP
jgi:hypothetical protein